ncbi:hypothetical protein [Kribbella sp. VKM Ac-2568]|uniref:hypothetical protein n=1 Tax=Kribbella sp. VKM Ac-2568 TaxID=2512219 RepID=UPI0010DD1580|nr:hypothetical protein [Kribbella sp. VKM Ac-2568]TCM47669.1 hypothetical protein EV648_10460 [Kribbella sp. VKM Ac-2568]
MPPGGFLGVVGRSGSGKTTLAPCLAALVWISHDLGPVAAVSDHVLVLDAGRVVEQGPPAAVMTEPRTDLTRWLVRAARVGRRLSEEPAPPPVLTSSADTRSDPR